MNKQTKALALCVLACAPSVALAQYTKTETLTYHDNTALWVLGQTATVTCVAPAECTPAYAPTGTAMSEITYNSLAQPVTVKSFGALQQTVTYQADGNVATVKDANNHVTTLASWKRGIPQSITFADSTSISAVVDDNGWISSATNEVSARTCYAYDPMGRITRVTYPSETVNNICDTTAWNETLQNFQQVLVAEYGIPVGHWRQSVSTGNGQKITYFDALWRPVLTKELDSTNGTTETLTKKFQRFAYDSDGRTTFASYPGLTDSLSTGTWSEYDALGRVTSVSQDTELAAPATTVTEYLTGFKTRVTNPRGQSTLSIYQTFDQPTYDFPAGIDHPEGASTEIYRNVFTRVYALRRRNNSTPLEEAWRWYVYQSDQKLCKVIEPETGATVYGYDWAGNLTKSAAGLQGYGDTSACNHEQAFASGRVVDRTYDARNRLKTLLFPDGAGNQQWNYTDDGQPADITVWNEPNGGFPIVSAYSYRKRGMLAGESMQQPGWYDWSMGYGYDRNGALATNTYPTGLAISYYPNALGQPTQVQDQAGQVYATGVQYFPNGGMKQFTYGNGIAHTMTQNVRQLPARIIDSGGVVDYDTRFDANGNVTDIYDYANGHIYNRHMQYDGLDRLTTAASWGFGGDGWHRFTYDTLDNLKSWKLAGVKDYATYVYDAHNQLTGIQNTAGATIVGLGYDLQGNLANKNGQTYLFDYGNRLRRVDGKEHYLYDAHGRRVLAWAVGGNNILSLYSQSGQLLYNEDYRRGFSEENVYLNGSLLTIREHNQATAAVRLLYQHTDALGSPVAVTDASGAVIKRNFYEPYGVVVGQPTYQGIGFTGHVQDGVTGLTYMQQRYYDPQIGRFLSVDPVTAYSLPGSNFNRYWYANNNPYRFLDPDGRLGLPNDDETRAVQRVAAQKASQDGEAGSMGGAMAQQIGEAVTDKETLKNAATQVAQDVGDATFETLDFLGSFAKCAATCAVTETVGVDVEDALDNIREGGVEETAEKASRNIPWAERALRGVKNLSVITGLVGYQMCQQECGYADSREKFHGEKK